MITLLFVAIAVAVVSVRAYRYLATLLGQIPDRNEDFELAVMEVESIAVHASESARRDGNSGRQESVSAA